MTPIYGITEGGVKKTGRDARVLPRTVIYDPSFTLALSPRISVVSGMNAIAHCVEGLYARDGNPVIAIMAQESIRLLARSLPAIVANPGSRDARYGALCGAWLAGAVLGAAGMALHHKLCHILGGSFNLPHAETHTAVLPQVVAYNAGAAPEAMARIAGAFTQGTAASALFDLAHSLGAEMALKRLGLGEGDLDRIAAVAVENPYYNPRPVTREGIRALLQRAFDGERPR
jgi:alcohol dehydrogenase class IV